MLRRQLNCSESTAEDLAQEALIRAMNPRVPAANLEIAPFGWLMKVARRLRDPRGRPMLPLRDDDARAPDVHAPDQPEARAFFFLAFQQALEKLSAEEREAVGLLARRVPGGQLKKRTGREIAQLMGKGESSVAKYLHSARGKIVKHFRVYHPGLYEEHGVYFRKFFEAQND
jgi:RNA polymerase sigma factor (sigma-70 family)